VSAPIKNLPASVRQRLLNVSKVRGEPFDLVLARFGIERLLYRLSRSAHAASFVLKGAMLFAVWSERTHRPTRDVDLLGFGPSDVDSLKQVFIEVCGAPVEPDGLEFQADTVNVEAIRDGAAYPGVRVNLVALLGKIRVPVQADIGFGDEVTPGPEEVNFPALLDFPAPRLRAYPVYTVAAEKLEAVVLLGEANTRMKDFYDLWFVSRRFEFDGAVLREAIARTFARRQSPVPTSTPPALRPEFAVLKDAQWTAFLRRNGLETVSLDAVLQRLRTFAEPALFAAATNVPFTARWTDVSGWKIQATG